MPAKHLGLILQHLRRWSNPDRLDYASDGQLLQRFAAGRDEAFAALVERHGPMVLGVCRRVLRDWHGAEDAFQAAFLVLARKAPALDKRSSIAAWLHTVARRLALRARHNAQKRRHRETPLVDSPAGERTSQLLDHERRAILDEELCRLTEKYRAPLVLCYLAGHTYEETARQLGWPKGTVAIRLARGRDILRRRLTRRGITLGVGLLGLELGEATAALPIALNEATVRTATTFALGGALSVPALALAKGALQTMLTQKLIRIGVALLLLGSLGTALGVLGYQAVAQSPELPRVNRIQSSPAASTQAEPAKPAPSQIDEYGDPLPPAALRRFGTVRFRHGLLITALGFTADGRTLGSASMDGTLRLWETATHKEIRKFDVFLKTDTFGLSADGRTVAAPVYEGNNITTIRIWDVATGQELQRIEPGMVVRNVVLTADGQSLFWGDDQGLHHWSIKDAKEVRSFGSDHGHILGLAASTDGKTLASSGSDGAIRLFEVATRKEFFHINGPQNSQLFMAYSPDGRIIASRAEKEQVVRLWDVATRRERTTLTLAKAELPFGNGAANQKEFGRSLAFSADGKFVATSVAEGSLWSVVVWDAASGDRLRIAPIPTMGGGGALSAVALAPDGRKLATGGLDNIVRMTDLNNRFGGNMANPHEGPVEALAVAPDGKTLATACEHGGIHLWDTASGRLLTSMPEVVDSGSRLAFSPDGQLLATHSVHDFRITLWDRGAGWDGPGGHGQRICEGHQKRIRAMWFAPDGKKLISWGGDQTIRHWDLAAGKEQGRVAAPGEEVYRAVFAPDGQWAAGVALGNAGDSTVVTLWNPATGAEVRRVEVSGSVVEALAFSPDSQFLAIAGQGETATTIRLLRVATGQEFRRWTDPLHKRILAIAFSPDGKTLATGSDRHLLLWEVATGRARARCDGHQAPITAIAYAPDGKTIYTASNDTTVLAWSAAGAPAP